MKILFIAPYVPSRIRVRPFQIIKELAKRHDVSVVALGESDKTRTEGVEEVMSLVNDLRVVPHSRTKGLLQACISLPLPAPLSAAYCWSGMMEREIKSVLSREQFDLIHVEHLRAAHFAPRKTKTPVVFDAVDCLTSLFCQMARAKKSLFARLVMRFEAFKLRYYEPRILSRFDRIVITTDSERKALLTLNPFLSIDVVPNGVDTNYFVPHGAQKMSRRVIFTGKMSYSPNAQAAAWFSREVFPKLRAKWPDAEFVIAGSNPPQSITALGSEPGIRVTGYLEDLRPEMDKASVAVAPMQSAVGVQNKVLEAMAMALPVVASSLAARPIGKCPGLFEADTAEEFAEAVGRLFTDPDAARDMGRQARDFVEKAFSWQAAVDKLEQIYEQVVNR